MDTGTLIFLIIGGVGVALLALALIGAEFFQFGDADVDGPVSVETVAAFAGAFGFAGAIARELLDARTPALLAVSAAIGLAAALPTAWFALRLTRLANNMNTDATPSRADVIGTLGVVVTPIPASGYGEVRVHLGGQPVKFNARAKQPIPLGARVFVIEALSETSVAVEETLDIP